MSHPVAKIEQREFNFFNAKSSGPDCVAYPHFLELFSFPVPEEMKEPISLPEWENGMISVIQVGYLVHSSSFMSLKLAADAIHSLFLGRTEVFEIPFLNTIKVNFADSFQSLSFTETDSHLLPRELFAERVNELKDYSRTVRLTAQEPGGGSVLSRFSGNLTTYGADPTQAFESSAGEEVRAGKIHYGGIKDIAEQIRSILYILEGN